MLTYISNQCLLKHIQITEMHLFKDAIIPEFPSIQFSFTL